MSLKSGESLDHSSSANVLEKKSLVTLWIVAGLAGLVQSVASRLYIEPDGLNYLDVAYAYLRADFPNAVNAYWSPLYSWLLAILIALTHCSSYWESTLLHALNFLMYLLALSGFAFFFREITSLMRNDGGEHGTNAPAGWAWNLLGYSIFVYASLELIRVGTDTPDLLVSAAFYFATGMLLRMRRGVAGWSTYFVFGVVLGLGYLAKAVMFPVSFAFLFCCFFAAGNVRRTFLRAVIAVGVFLLIASPWLFTLSKAKARFTFGDVGPLSYVRYVAATGKPIHPIRLGSGNPQVEEFATPVAGTYPPWYDSTYWNEGLRPHFEVRAQLRALRINLGQYFLMLSAQKGIAVGLFVLIFVSDRVREWMSRFLKLWPFWFSSILTLGLYGLVYVETRYLGAAVVILWVVLFATSAIPRWGSAGRIWRACLCAVSISILLTVAAELGRDVSTIMASPQHAEWQAAEELSRLGVRPGDLAALIGHSSEAADYWAHLAKIRIVAQVPSESASSYWDGDRETRRRVQSDFAKAGASVIVTRIPPKDFRGDDWRRLGSTAYYALLLPTAKNSEQHH